MRKSIEYKKEKKRNEASNILELCLKKKKTQICINNNGLNTNFIRQRLRK